MTRSVPALGGGEDFTIAGDGSILMAREGGLYRVRPGADRWELLADWTGSLPGSITRIAMSPTGRHLAFVVREPGDG